MLVSGMSPQIVTETLYALTQVIRPAFTPTQVHLVTTRHGADQARLNLLEGPCHFQRLCHDYGLDANIFTNERIHVIRNYSGHEIDDIRTPDENEATADFITEQVLHFTADDNTALHVSMAGGRKTMGFYAGYALSLFGRPQDRLSHVLVSEGYEGLHDFYYPTPRPNTIQNRDGKALDTSRAAVSLAQIPFVPLRGGLPSGLLKGGQGFTRTVEQARLANHPITLSLNPVHRTYRVGPISGNLSPVSMALLLWMAQRRDSSLPALVPLVDEEHNHDYAEELLALEDHYGLSLNLRTQDTLRKDGVTKPFIETNVSRLNRTLAEQLGPDLAARCKLAVYQHGNRSGYDLPQDIDVIIEQDML